VEGPCRELSMIRAATIICKTRGVPAASVVLTPRFRGERSLCDKTPRVFGWKKFVEESHSIGEVTRGRRRLAVEDGIAILK